MSIPADDVGPIVFADTGDLTGPPAPTPTTAGQVRTAVAAFPLLGSAQLWAGPLLSGARGRIGTTMQIVGATVQARVVPAVQDAGTRLTPGYVAVRDRTRNTVRTAGGQLAARAVQVRPIVVDAGGRSWDTVQVRVVPMVRDTRDRLSPVLTDATARGGTAARTLQTRVRIGADPVAREASRRGANVVRALRGGSVAPVVSRARTVRRLLTVGAAAGLSYGAWWALAGKPDSLWKTTTADGRFRHANGTDPTRSDLGSSDLVSPSLVNDVATASPGAPITDPLLPLDLSVIVIGADASEEFPNGGVDLPHAAT